MKNVFSSLFFLVSNLQGKQITQIPIAGQNGSKEWATDEVDAGIYYCQLRFLNGESGVIKVAIIK